MRAECPAHLLYSKTGDFSTFPTATVPTPLAGMEPRSAASVRGSVQLTVAAALTDGDVCRLASGSKNSSRMEPVTLPPPRRHVKLT